MTIFVRALHVVSDASRGLCVVLLWLGVRHRFPISGFVATLCLCECMENAGLTEGPCSAAQKHLGCSGRYWRGSDIAQLTKSVWHQASTPAQKALSDLSITGIETVQHESLLPPSISCLELESRVNDCSWFLI